MLGAVLLCYIFAAAGWSGLALLIPFVALLGFAALSLRAVRDRRMLGMVVVVIALLVIALGSPSDEWDPRSIWLFHAKRMYVEGTLYAQLDGYAPWSHNDYPSLVPLLMATSAQAVGHWNEVFPKVIGTLLLLPALLLIARSFRSGWWAALFAVATLKLGGTYLVDGYMDALLAVYAVASLATAIKLGESRSPLRWSDAAAYLLVTATLVLIKNEGLVIATVIVGCALADGLLRHRRMPWPLAGAFVLALLPLLAWKVAVAGAHLSNDLADSDLKGQLLARLPDASQSLLVLKKLLRAWAWVPLLVLAVLWRRTTRAPAALVGACVAVAYAAVLYLVYMSTPHDLDWHLATSARRTVLPVLLLLVYALLVVVDQWRDGKTTATEQQHG